MILTGHCLFIKTKVIIILVILKIKILEVNVFSFRFLNKRDWIRK